MAEERLIDDDKDRKYKIRKNADGEDELYIDEGEEQEEQEDVGFEVPEFAYDDESVADMTPEQYQAAMEAREREERMKAERLVALTADVDEGLEAADYARALTAANAVLEEYGESGRFYCAKLRAVTKDFTDYTFADEIENASEGVKSFASAEEKEALYEKYGAAVKEEEQRRRAAADELNAQNEEKKEERRAKFVPRKRRAQKLFIATAAPLAVFLVLGIVFASIMLSRQDGLYMVLAIVFGALALVFAVLTVITARGFVQTARNVRLNEKNTSTKLGRSYLEAQKNLSVLEGILAAISPENK